VSKLHFLTVIALAKILKIMRLSQQQIIILKQIASEVFGPQVKIKLFGSRTDDKQRGGDIDLYVSGFNQTPMRQFEAKLNFLVKAKLALGEQRIDLVFAPSDQQPPQPIQIEAERTGIAL
jgi:predicted nucleotidyltransferase